MTDENSPAINTLRLSRRKKILFRAVIFFGTLFIGFLVLECFVRINYENIDLLVLTGRKPGGSSLAQWTLIDAFCAYRAKPAFYGNRGNRVKKTVNRYGFMSTPELDIEKEPGEIRIAFFGGSSTAGTGYVLSDEKTWPLKAARMIQDQFPGRKITFINAALGGYSSFESYGRLWSRVRFFKPDIIVVYHGWNEMYYFNEEKVENMIDWRTLPDGSWGFPEDEPFEEYPQMWVDHFIRFSQVLTRFRVRGEPPGEVSDRSEEEPLARDFDHRGLDIWRTNLILFRETAKILGVELFVCKQATMIVPFLDTRNQKLIPYYFHGFNHYAHVKAFEGIYRVIDEEIPENRIIDVTPISGCFECFKDHVHPTDEGTSRIARIVATQLAQYLKTRTEPPASERSGQDH